MSNNELILITGDKQFYGQTRKAWVPMDVSLIKERLSEKGFDVTINTIQDMCNRIINPENKTILYSFSQKDNVRQYIRDVLTFLSRNNRIIPSLDLLYCHENKGFQELYKKDKGFTGLKAWYFSSLQDIDAYDIPYPVVLKTIYGSNGKGVFLIRNRDELEKQVGALTEIGLITKLDLCRRRYFRKRTYPDYPNHSDYKDYLQYKEYITKNENFILAAFGDMTRVPTSVGSLQTVVASKNSWIKIVYSPFKALEIAKNNPGKDVVFFGSGFETTVPGIALSVREAAEGKVDNYSVLSAFWVIPPPLRVIVTSDSSIHGFIYPGHVSAIIGSTPYSFISNDFHIAGAIAGFEPADVLLAVNSIIDQIRAGKPVVDNVYGRVVKPGGNPAAQKIMKEMLESKDAYWRGLGKIPASGLKFKKQFSFYDAELKYGIDLKFGSGDLSGCRCGDVLQGKISPQECPLFGMACKPDSPRGPCMVSFEGACSSHYKYSRRYT